jgi:GNAT superfamily N-acetyltransferase
MQAFCNFDYLPVSELCHYDASGMVGVVHVETLAAEPAPFDSEAALADGMAQAETKLGTGSTIAPASAVHLVTSSARFLKNIESSSDALVNQIVQLSKEAFGEDEEVMQLKKKEQVAVLLIGEKVVCYASHMIRKDVSSFCINKLAVTNAYRRCGLGRMMIRHLVQLAKCRNRYETSLEVICLSALPDAVGFYKACGLRADHLVKPACSTDAVEGQVYMEYTLRRSSKARSVSNVRSASKRAR